MGEWDPCLSFPRAGDLLGAAAFAPFLTQNRWQASWPHPGHLTVGTRGGPRSPVTSQLLPSHPVPPTRGPALGHPPWGYIEIKIIGLLLTY